jgi:NADPH:quinone reductase-like Zn-dependent oxidoreductase
VRQQSCRSGKPRLRQKKIQPIIAERFPLEDARRAHELPGQGGVAGRIVLVCNPAEPFAAFSR